jgi:DNA repair protein RadC
MERTMIEIKVDGTVVFQSRSPAVKYGEGEPINQAADAEKRFATIREMPQEVFAVMSLNGANKVLKIRWVTVGLLDSNQVHPREVFADPITDRAASIIVAHNHPSGMLEPSREDIALTKRLQKAGDLLGIKVLDHLILTKDGMVSLKQRGEI